MRYATVFTVSQSVFGHNCIFNSSLHFCMLIPSTFKLPQMMLVRLESLCGRCVPPLRFLSCLTPFAGKSRVSHDTASERPYPDLGRVANLDVLRQF